MKKSLYNIVFGVLGQIITILIGLTLPRLRIVSFGSEINGMLSSIQQIYTYLALLEAGIGSATLQALYGPVARKDKDAVNGILAATDKYYKKTGFIYLIAILCFAFVYPLIVHTNIPVITMVLVILFNGLGNVLVFFFQGKFRILLEAEGKQYITTNLMTAVTVLSGITKIVLIYCGFNVVSLQVAYFLFNILQVLYYLWYIKRHYKWINLDVKENTDAISQKNSVLIHQISQMIFNNTDVTILTIFCGFKIVSVYALYNLIYEMASTFIQNINNGFTFKLGQLYNSDRSRFDKIYILYEQYYTAFSFAFYCVAYLFISYFIKLYTYDVNDINYSMKYLPLLFTMIKLMVSGRAPSGFLASYAGHFKLTQNRAIFEAILNLSVSLVFVNLCGVYGVLIGTIVALLYRANDMIIYANRKILSRNPWKTYKWWVLDISIFIIVVCIYKLIRFDINGYFEFFIIAVMSAIIILTAFICVNLIFSYKKTVYFFKDIFHRN